jgi:hypothetical protein
MLLLEDVDGEDGFLQFSSTSEELELLVGTAQPTGSKHTHA